MLTPQRNQPGQERLSSFWRQVRGMGRDATDIALDRVEDKVPSLGILKHVSRRRAIMALLAAGAALLSKDREDDSDVAKERREAKRIPVREIVLDGTNVAFWSLAEGIRRQIVNSRDPRFVELQERFGSEELADSIWEIVQFVIDFNRLRRGDEWLSDINDEFTNVPRGTKVAIPRDPTQLFASIVSTVAEGQNDAEEAAAHIERVENSTTSTELKEVLSGKRRYVDAHFDATGAEKFPSASAPSMQDRREEGDADRDTMDKEYIVLHSTITPQAIKPEDAGKTTEAVVSGLLLNNKAHYLVGRDGTIHYLLDDAAITDHAGNFDDVVTKAIWDGHQDISDRSIGIEVEASAGENWNEAQIASMKKLIAHLGGKYGMTKDRVVTHAQISCFKWGEQILRQRKSDPRYKPGPDGRNLFELLGLPPNDLLYDRDLAMGTVAFNPSILTHADHSNEKTKANASRGYVFAAQQSDALRKRAGVAVKTYPIPKPAPRATPKIQPKAEVKKKQEKAARTLPANRKKAAPVRKPAKKPLPTRRHQGR